MLAQSDGRGIQSCLFLNAQNKQTIHEILGPLRELGIPCAAIVDVDMIDSSHSWTTLFKAAHVPDASIASMNINRDRCYKILKPISDYKKKGGINLLTGQDKAASVDLFDAGDQYGIFVIRHGELENWLAKHGPIVGKGPEWLINAFEKMGDDPSSENYIRPASNDVWAFIDKIKAWFENPGRKGIPSIEDQEAKAEESKNTTINIQ
jgi:hypothetical protein